MIPNDTAAGTKIWLVNGISVPQEAIVVGFYDKMPIAVTPNYQYRGYGSDVYLTLAEANIEAARRMRREARKYLERADELEQGTGVTQ